MKKQRAEQPIDPSQLASGYMFPELFEPPPFALRSQEAHDSPFEPQPKPIQHQIPDMPPIDWDHIRRLQHKQKLARRRRK